MGIVLKAKDVPLTPEQIVESIPSIYQTERYEPTTTDRYNVFTTGNLIDVFGDAGWMPFQAQAASVRDEFRKEFSKHLVRFRRLDDTFAPGEYIPELVVSNSNDGKTAFNIMLGIFRVVCSNGLIRSVGASNYRVRHAGHTESELIGVAQRSIDEFGEVSKEISIFKDVKMNAEDRLGFAGFAIANRFGAGAGNWESQAVVEQILSPIRNEDAGNTVWDTMNILQEKLVSGTTVMNPGRNKGGDEAKIRSLNNIERLIGFNSALWDYARQYTGIVTE